MAKSIGTILFVVCLLVIPSAFAGVIVTGGHADVTASDVTLDPGNATNTFDRINISGWVSSFDHSTSEGRASMFAGHGYQSDSNGFQFDVLAASGAIGSGPGSAGGEFHTITASGQINFSLTALSNYSITGSAEGGASANNLLAGFGVQIYSFDLGDFVYREFHQATNENSFSATMGIAPTLNDVGSNIGNLAAGDYSLFWDLRASDALGTHAVNLAGDLSIQVGSFAAVPEPNAFILLLGGLLLILQIRDTHRLIG